jgi:hypothetical protein
MRWRYVILGAFVIAIAWFGYYAISPIFMNNRLDEALPESSSSTAGNEEKNRPGDVVMSKQDGQVGEDNLETSPAQISGTTGHPASGTARIVNADGQRYLRYENFKTINGPDIFVYLSKDLDAKDFVNLGQVKATEGNVNYEIPDNIDPRDYPYALVWCKQFSILFNSAKLY